MHHISEIDISHCNGHTSIMQQILVIKWFSEGLTYLMSDYF